MYRLGRASNRTQSFKHGRQTLPTELHPQPRTGFLSGVESPDVGAMAARALHGTVLLSWSVTESSGKFTLPRAVLHTLLAHKRVKAAHTRSSHISGHYLELQVSYWPGVQGTCLRRGRQIPIDVSGLYPSSILSPFSVLAICSGMCFCYDWFLMYLLVCVFGM